VRRLVLIAVLVALGAAPALAANPNFPGSNPDESVRANTPDDPGFDSCEPDNPGGSTCGSVFSEQYERFGFAPFATQLTATYKNPGGTQREQQQNLAAGRNPLGQIPGVSADRAWKRSTGDPRVRIAILDTGIRWEKESLRKRIALNAKELPKPRGCTKYDCNGDGAFNVDDYASDSRVHKNGGDAPADSILDGSDLIAAFSDKTDKDKNGYVDDIAGWDYFNDDNDPFDASSYSSASNHGSGRSEDAAEEGNDATGSLGICLKCQIVPMRVWDTFVVDMNNFAQAVAYAGDNGIQVVEGAVGGLFNSRFAQQAFDYAYRKGTFLTIVSSDLNTSDHNIPTLYDEAFHVQGTVADVQGLAGGPPAEVGSFLGGQGLDVNAPLGTWFRNSGTTQYGAHAHIVMPAVTGSQATGQASGAAGLVASYALQKGIKLAPNEIKQLLTLTAQDVVPENTVGLGVADPAHPGWDQHFGYGLPDLGLALERVSQKKFPPQVLIDSPEWFKPLNVSKTRSIGIRARLSARTGGYAWKLQWAPGIEPQEADFKDVSSGNGSAPRDSTLGTIDLAAVRAALDARPGGGATDDPTAPAKGSGDRDPNEPAFTVRVVVTDANGNRGEDRKMLFAYRDPTLHPGFSKQIGTGGEAAQRLFDLNGDNRLDIVQADSSGRLNVLDSSGRPLGSFNGGKAVTSRPYSNAHAATGAIRSGISAPREVLRTPAIGDVDGDLEPDIVDSAGEHVYAWHANGKPLKGFPVRLNPSFSRPQDISKDNHVKRGFFASPTLGDLNGDHRLDITLPGLDQHLYAWDGRKAKPLPGFPRLLKVSAEKLTGAESINNAAVGDVNGDGKKEIVAPTAELAGTENPSTPDTNEFRSLVITLLSNAIGGSGRTYALDGKGRFLPGWPIKPNGGVPDALPLVGPGVDPVMGDVDGDGKLDVINNAATGDLQSFRADGSRITVYDSTPATGEHVDKSRVLNLFENPIVANLDGQPGLEVIKGGLTLNQIVNLGVATGQNLPYNHVVQAWDGKTGNELPAFPQAVEDYQLLSSPAVADVSDAPGKEILVGTGLYYLRDFNADGTEGTGFPKFTGGWLFSVPAVGDTDGDGKLEINALTREGYAFQWDTNSPACGTNDEWWTARHDEWNTGAYGTDSRPPGTPRSFSIKRSGGRATLSWLAPGDDWLCGNAKRYRVLASSKPITQVKGTHSLGNFTAQALGKRERRTVRTSSKDRYFAVLYQDDAGNWGAFAPNPKARGGGSTGTGPQLKLTVSPRRVSTGDECFRFRVTAKGRPVAKATVHIVGRSRRTASSGRTEICVLIRRAGRYTATASRAGYRSARTTVQVTGEPRSDRRRH
jgi:subtilase family protein